jgi:ribosomal protein L11 methylase PrmA
MDVALRCVILADGDTTAAIAAEVVSLVLFDLGALAVGEEDQGEGLVLVAGFAGRQDALRALEHLTKHYSTLLASATIDDRLAQDWVATQQAALVPTTVGPWHIRGPWTAPPPGLDPRYDILIDPGAAFGHGGHPSTRLATELLVRSHPDTHHVVDIGTGTGVIAILAARLGYTVTAVENDSVAAKVAQHNFALNSSNPAHRVDDRITLTVADGSALMADRDALVVANVTLDVQRLIASRCQHVRRIIISGVLCRQVGQVRLLYPSHEAVTIRAFGDWAALELSLKRPGDATHKR